MLGDTENIGVVEPFFAAQFLKIKRGGLPKWKAYKKNKQEKQVSVKPFQFVIVINA